MSTAREQVLVFPAEALLPYLGWFEAGGGVVSDPGHVRMVLDATVHGKQLQFMDREAAERDPSFKQVIPYCVLWSEDEDGRYVFAYRRTKKGGETRLHERWSLGVGGHINPVDGEATSTAYPAAFRREMLEEVGLDPGEVSPTKALLYDPSDEVGRVHFGVVHLVKVPHYGMEPKDPSLGDWRWTGWYARNKLLADGKFESWSALILRSVELPDGPIHDGREHPIAGEAGVLQGGAQS